MATKYVCDVCGKEHVDSAMVRTPYGFQTPTGTPQGWAAISVMAPERLTSKQTRIGYAYGYGSLPQPWFVIVCSQSCAEKALDEAKEHLRETFEKANQVSHD